MKAQKSSKHISGLIVALLILIGLNMRTGLTIVPPILNNIQATLELPQWFLGSLTTIPLICFTVVSPFVDRLRKKLGLIQVLSLGLIVLAVGFFIRIYSFNFLLLGTLLTGAGIAVLNVLAPAVVSTFFPDKIGLMTSMYSLSMTVFSAISAGISAPLASKVGWQPMLQVLVAFPILTLLIAQATKRYQHQNVQQETTTEEVPHGNVWRQRTTWLMTGYMGIQSLLFYTVLTWIPQMLIDHGISQNVSSVLLGIMQLAAVPMSYLIPIMAGKREKQTPLMLMTAGLFLVGLGSLMIPSTSTALGVLSCVLLGFATNSGFNMSMILFSLKSRNLSETVAVSGMAQSMGYLIAAVGPLAAGMIYSQLEDWHLIIALLIVLAMVMMTCGLLLDRHKYFFE